MMANILAQAVPHRGDPASSSFISESRPRGFLHTPMWADISPSGFSARITWERSTKPPISYLIGGISPCLILWRATCPGWLSPPKGDPGSTQILTWHFGAQSQTISQLASSGTTPSIKSSQFSPSRLTNKLRTGSMRILHHNSNNPDGTMGLL
jgi:hypothetical protein